MEEVGKVVLLFRGCPSSGLIFSTYLMHGCILNCLGDGEVEIPSKLFDSNRRGCRHSILTNLPVLSALLPLLLILQLFNLVLTVLALILRLLLVVSLLLVIFTLSRINRLCLHLSLKALRLILNISLFVRRRHFKDICCRMVMS
jgi:hypothetical protein